MKTEYLKLEINEIGEKAQKKIKVFNYGLALLKVILEFLVVKAHNFNSKSTKNKVILYITKERSLHVPSFFIMSFYFMYKNIFSLNIKILFKRLIRLLIPYIIWPIIIWNLNHLWNKKFNTKLADSYEDLIIQLLWGHNYTPQFWFLWNLFMITIFLTIIIFIFRKHSSFIFQLILILFYIAQYSGYDHKIYVKYLDNKKKTPVLLFASVPYAITGYTLGFYKIIDFILLNKLKSLILSMTIYKFVADYNIFIDIKDLFYKGIKFNIQSICIIFIFSFFPSDKIKNKYIVNFLKLITNYTAGVYYLHYALRYYLNIYFYDIKKGTFLGLFINYFICYFICFLGMLIFGKTPFKYLFC